MELPGTQERRGGSYEGHGWDATDWDADWDGTDWDGGLRRWDSGLYCTVDIGLWGIELLAFRNMEMMLVDALMEDGQVRARSTSCNGEQMSGQSWIRESEVIR